jgi:hypothetical protein
MVERLVLALLPDGGRLLLTGFAPWGQVLDNPSGAFVASPRALATLAGSDAPIPGRGVLVAKGARREIVAAVLSVDDSALATIGHLHTAFRPDAALGMGVVANGDTDERTYRIELSATNRNLALRHGRWAHADGSPATVIRPTPALRAALRRA